MLPRIMASALAVLIMAWTVGVAAVASDSTDGTIEKAGSGTITVKDKDGTSHTFDVDTAAKITLDGKSANLADLPTGSSATVTTESKNNKSVAVMIVARSKL